MRFLNPACTLLAASALALPASAGGASQEQCFTDTIDLMTTQWVDSVTVSRFDPDLGILLGIRFELRGRVAGSAAVENRDALSADVTLTYTGMIILQRPDNSEIARVQPLQEFDLSLAAFDGMEDFAGPSGMNFPAVEASAMTTANSPRPMSDLALFTGPGGNPGTITLPVLANGMSSCSGAGNLLCQFAQAAEAEVRVCYFYALDCDDNGIPDDQQPDCNGNGIPDECDEDPCELEDIPCLEWDLNIDLTPLDTFTAPTRAVNPDHEQGYFYAYARSLGGDPIKADYLIGHLIVVDGMMGLQYGVNPVDYRAGAALMDGASTDLDGDGVRDLNGLEYEKTAGELLFPHFLGQGGRVSGDLIMIALSGGSRFDTTLQFAIYNDEEDRFSAQHRFYCWDKVSLRDVSGVFRNSFLQNTNSNNEHLGVTEYGWFKMWGGIASSGFFDIQDPAVFGVYVEHINQSSAADLPFEACTQSGHLLPQGNSGDNEELFGAPSDQDCNVNIDRRHPASFLLFPEFDNRHGVTTVFTLTNTSRTKNVRAHVVFRGRYR